MDKFSGLEVTLTSGENGVIEGAFGKSGKFKVRLLEAASAQLMSVGNGKQNEKTIEVKLLLKKHIFAKDKQLKQ